MTSTRQHLLLELIASKLNEYAPNSRNHILAAGLEAIRENSLPQWIQEVYEHIQNGQSAILEHTVSPAVYHLVIVYMACGGYQWTQ